MSHTTTKPMKYLHKMTAGGAFLAVSPKKTGVIHHSCFSNLTKSILYEKTR